MKKIITVLLLIVCFFSLSACKKEERFDYTELSDRLSSKNEAFGFDCEGIFCSDSVYYIYYSFVTENDILLTVKEDEGGNLTRITLSIWQNADENCLTIYKQFCKTLTSVFVPKEKNENMAEETGLFDEGVMFTQFMRKIEKTNYTARFFSSENGAVYVLSYSQ